MSDKTGREIISGPTDNAPDVQFGLMFDGIKSVIDHATEQKKRGEKYPVVGMVDCPQCKNTTLEYVVNGPRACRAVCTCGFKFMS